MITVFGEDELPDGIVNRVSDIAEMLSFEDISIETMNGTAKVVFDNSPIMPEMWGYVDNIKDRNSWDEMLEIIVNSGYDYVNGSEQDYGNRESYEEASA